MEKDSLNFEEWVKLSEQEKEYLRQKNLIETPAILQFPLNALLLKFLNKWSNDKDEVYLNELVIKLRLSKITMVFQDSYLTDDLLMKWDDSLDRLFMYIKEFIIPSSSILSSEVIQEKKATNQKLRWKGTPSQFGFIVDLLIQGEYLEKPTSSFPKDAEYYLRAFDIETTPQTLAKELSENSNSITPANRKKVSIPHKDKLS